VPWHDPEREPALPRIVASRRAPSIAVAALVVASSALRAWAGTRVVTPWVNPDEIIYSQLGRSLYLTGHLWMLGRPIGYLSSLYPALVGLPLLSHDAGAGYAVLKVVQAVAMSLTAVPVYLWARTLVRPWWAVVAAALTVSIPGLAYSGLIMSEVAFYPLMTLAAWAMARALMRPSAGNQLLMLAAVALAVATRVQALVLVPILVSAILAKAWLDRGGLATLLRRFAPTLLVLLAAVVGWTVYGLHAGRSGALLGGYQSVATTHITPAIALHFVAYHAADVFLLTALVPACGALLVLVGSRNSDEAVRAYAAVAAAFVIWLVAEVGVFASRYVGHLAERNLLPLAPVLFIGFAIWLDRGLRRPPTATAAIVAVAVALLAYLPLSEFVQHSLPDTFTLLPLDRLKAIQPHANLGLVLAYVGVPLLLLFLLVPRRFAVVLPLGVVAVLITASVSVSETVADTSRLLVPHVFGSSRNWVDRAARGPVAYLYAGEPDFSQVYENVFWNRKIDAVALLPGPPVPGTLPQVPVQPSTAGTLTTSDRSALQEGYVVAGSSFILRGTRVAAAPVPGLALWRVRRPASISAWLAGVDVAKADERDRDLLVSGAIRGAAELVFYDCDGGTLRLTLVSDQAADVALSRSGRLVRRLRLVPGRPQTVVLKAIAFSARATPPIAARYRPAPGGQARQCEFGLAASGGAVALQPLEFARSLGP
jgi:hypothetical protein